MSDDEALQRRLRAVERSLTDGDHDVDSLRAAGDRADRIEELEERLADAEDRIAELEASTQALRGYVGNVRSVNEDVEQRADAALAAVERLEERFDDTQQVDTAPVGPPAPHGSPGRGRASRRAGVTAADRQWTDADGGTYDGTGEDSFESDHGDRDDGDDGLIARLRRAL